MFGTNDPYSASTELPDLLAHLEAVYREEKRIPTGVVLTDSAEDFLNFVSRYLGEHRPSEVFVVDNNYGILLTNGQRVKLCPDPEGEVTQQTGDMANPGVEVDITRRN